MEPESAHKTEKIKGHCPNCGANINAGVMASHKTSWSDDYDPIWGETDYRILRCCGCDAVYFQKAEVFSENMDYPYHPVTGETQAEYIVDYSYWPSPLKRTRPEWLNDLISIDKKLYDIMGEVYTALDNDLKVLTAIGIRTSFDRGTELLNVDPAKSFFEKLNDLWSSGKIGQSEKDTLEVLSDAGGAAAHRGWEPTIDRTIRYHDGYNRGILSPKFCS
jgi:hypothetical protein